MEVTKKCFCGRKMIQIAPDKYVCSKCKIVLKTAPQNRKTHRLHFKISEIKPSTNFFR